METGQLPGAPDRLNLRSSPSPFADRTSISFRLEESAPVRVSVHDVSGREIARLADGWHLAGHHERIWNGCNERGEQMPTGVYWVRVQSGTIKKTRAVVMAR